MARMTNSTDALPLSSQEMDGDPRREDKLRAKERVMVKADVPSRPPQLHQ